MPRCLFLAGFDPLMLGYEKKESLFLPGEFLRAVFNLAGIVMLTVLLDGVVAGKWKKTGRRLKVEWFGTVSAPKREAAREAVASLWGDLSAFDEQNA